MASWPPSVNRALFQVVNNLQGRFITDVSAITVLRDFLVLGDVISLSLSGISDGWQDAPTELSVTGSAPQVEEGDRGSARALLCGAVLLESGHLSSHVISAICARCIANDEHCALFHELRSSAASFLARPQDTARFVHLRQCIWAVTALVHTAAVQGLGSGKALLSGYEYEELLCCLFQLLSHREHTVDCADTAGPRRSVGLLLRLLLVPQVYSALRGGIGGDDAIAEQLMMSCIGRALVRLSQAPWPVVEVGPADCHGPDRADEPSGHQPLRWLWRGLLVCIEAGRLCCSPTDAQVSAGASGFSATQAWAMQRHGLWREMTSSLWEGQGGVGGQDVGWAKLLAARPLWRTDGRPPHPVWSPPLRAYGAVLLDAGLAILCTLLRAVPRMPVGRSAWVAGEAVLRGGAPLALSFGPNGLGLAPSQAQAKRAGGNGTGNHSGDQDQGPTANDDDDDSIKAAVRFHALLEQAHDELRNPARVWPAHGHGHGRGDHGLATDGQASAGEVDGVVYGPASGPPVTPLQIVLIRLLWRGEFSPTDTLAAARASSAMPGPGGAEKVTRPPAMTSGPWLAWLSAADGSLPGQYTGTEDGGDAALGLAGARAGLATCMRAASALRAGLKQAVEEQESIDPNTISDEELGSLAGLRMVSRGEGSGPPPAMLEFARAMLTTSLAARAAGRRQAVSHELDAAYISYKNSAAIMPVPLAGAPEPVLQELRLALAPDSGMGISTGSGPGSGGPWVMPSPSLSSSVSSPLAGTPTAGGPRTAVRQGGVSASGGPPRSPAMVARPALSLDVGSGSTEDTGLPTIARLGSPPAAPLMWRPPKRPSRLGGSPAVGPAKVQPPPLPSLSYLRKAGEQEEQEQAQHSSAADTTGLKDKEGFGSGASSQAPSTVDSTAVAVPDEPHGQQPSGSAVDAAGGGAGEARPMSSQQREDAGRTGQVDGSAPDTAAVPAPAPAPAPPHGRNDSLSLSDDEEEEEEEGQGPRGDGATARRPSTLYRDRAAKAKAKVPWPEEPPGLHMGTVGPEGDMGAEDVTDATEGPPSPPADLATASLLAPFQLPHQDHNSLDISGHAYALSLLRILVPATAAGLTPQQVAALLGNWVQMLEFLVQWYADQEAATGAGGRGAHSLVVKGGPPVHPLTGHPLSARRCRTLVNACSLLRTVCASRPGVAISTLNPIQGYVLPLEGLAQLGPQDGGGYSGGVPCIEAPALAGLKPLVRHLGLWRRSHLNIVTSIYKYVPCGGTALPAVVSTTANRLRRRPRAASTGDGDDNDPDWAETPSVMASLLARARDEEKNISPPLRIMARAGADGGPGPGPVAAAASAELAGEAAGLGDGDRSPPLRPPPKDSGGSGKAGLPEDQGQGDAEDGDGLGRGGNGQGDAEADQSERAAGLVGAQLRGSMASLRQWVREHPDQARAVRAQLASEDEQAGHGTSQHTRHRDKNVFPEEPATVTGAGVEGEGGDMARGSIRVPVMRRLSSFGRAHVGDPACAQALEEHVARMLKDWETARAAAV